MADSEDHCGSSSASSKSTPPIAIKLEFPWKNQQSSMPRWCVKNESSGGHNVMQNGVRYGKVKSDAPDDAEEEESGLELSLGLSLGGPVSKLKSKNYQNESSGNGAKSQKVKQEEPTTCPFAKDHVGLMRRVSDGGISRTHAFWQEVSVSRDSLKEEKATLNSEANRHASQSNSTQSSAISILSSLCPPMIGLSPMHGGLTQTRSYPTGNFKEEHQASFPNYLWLAVHDEKASLVDHVIAKEEEPLLEEPSGSTLAIAPAPSRGCVGQGGKGLLEGFKDNNGEGCMRMTLSSVGKKSPITYRLQNGSTDSMQSSENAFNVSQLSGDGGPLQQCTSVGNLEVSPKDGSTNAATDQQQQLRQAQDSMDQQKKQRRQEARKKRKAVIEEQKLQKKVKKDDDHLVGFGQPEKQNFNPSARLATISSGRSKVSSTGPVPATSREVSTETHEASSPPDSQDGGSSNSAFPRTGSSTWQPGSLCDGTASTSSPDKPLEVGGPSNENDDGKHLYEIRQALQREREKEKGQELGKEKEIEGSEGDSEGKTSVEVVYLQRYRGEEPTNSHSGVYPTCHEPSGLVPAASSVTRELNMASASWVQIMADMQVNNQNPYEMAAGLLENKERYLKWLPDLNGIQTILVPPVSPTVDRERMQVSGQSIVELTELSEECSTLESTDGRLPSTMANVGNGSNSLPGGLPPESSSTMGKVSFSQLPHFPLMHVSYPFPLPPKGMPFSMACPIPYLMQFTPSSDSNLGKDWCRTPLPASFQVASNFPQYSVPIPSEVPSNWTPVVRPLATPPNSPPRPLVRSASGVAEDQISQGVECDKALANRSALSSKDVPPAYSSYQLPRSLFLGGRPIQVGAFTRLPSASSQPSTSTPQFGPVHTRSDTGVFGFRHSSVNTNSAFASLVAAVEASQGLSAAVASVSIGPGRTSLGPAGNVPKLDRSSTLAQLDAHEDTSGVTSSSRAGSKQRESLCTEAIMMASNLHGDGGKSIQSNRFQQGTTQAIPSTEGLVNHVGLEASSLKLGIAAGQMFGGSGSSPDLPWVTCAGAGPNGKTICGVLYRYKKGQVRIVCACHGCHMSPGEFVQHAGSVDLSNPEKHIVVGPFNLGNQAASVQG